MLKMIYGKSHCEKCGKEFEWRRSKTQSLARFCSKKCWYENNAKKLASLNDERFNWKTANEEQKKDWLRSQFERKVDKKDGCWNWIGTKDKNGYGQLNVQSNRQGKAHRVSWQLYKGEIPKNLSVLHKCDNPSCTNPEHLFLGTPKENSQDMAKKGRSTKGEKNSKSKLTNESVKKIKELLKMGVTQKRIAQDFKISPSSIGYIARGETWKHIE